MYNYPTPSTHRTFFVDVMLNERFLFTMPYRNCTIFKLNIEDIYNKVISKRPSLKIKPIELYID